MLSSFTEKLSKLYYGWRMIGLVSAIRVVGGGLHQYGFTVFFLPVSQELGISRAMTSLAFSLARAEGAIESPVAGYLIDRYGPSPMMVAACLLAGIGYILFSYINSYTTFLIVYLGVISLAFTAGFIHAPTIVANSWFIRLRARAMTVVSSAVPIGGTLITPLLAVVVTQLGWRWGAFIAGILFIVLGVPLAMLVRRSPESMGMLPDGVAVQPEDGKATASSGSVHEPEVTAKQAFRMALFWIMIVSMTARGAAFATVTTHFIPMMVWKGLSQQHAAFLLAGFAMINLLVHFLLGWIADFVNKPKVVTICMFIGAAAVLPMIWSDSLWALWMFTAFYTVLDASIPVYWASVGDFFGRKSFGTLRGNMNLFYTWGNVCGPVIAGAIYDQTQSYATVLWGMTSALFFAAILTSRLIRPWAQLKRSR